MSKKVLLPRSTEISSGLPAVPSELDYGELAINYHNGKETLFIQNDNDEIISFSSDNTLINYIDSKLELSLSYAMSSLSNNNLQLAPGDTYDEAFGKLEKIINDNEIISSACLTDLDNRVILVENSKWSKSELGIMTTTEIQSIWDQVFNDE